MAICKEAEHLCLWKHGSVEFVFFSLQSDTSSITCNDTNIFQIVLVESGLEYILKFFCKISFK